jgi:hypothetical protein
MPTASQTAAAIAGACGLPALSPTPLGAEPPRPEGFSITIVSSLAKDGRQHAINLLDSFNGARVHAVDVRWTRKKGSRPTLVHKNRL